FVLFDDIQDVNSLPQVKSVFARVVVKFPRRRNSQHYILQDITVYYLGDEPEVHFIWQPSQELSSLDMSHAFDDYYIMDCGIISALDVTQRRTDSND
ncbi:hypothetical protein ACJX0J_041711, partial [Zea mays]